MAFADLGTTQLFYTDEGAGEPAVLFVHGFACDSNDWIWQLPHFGLNHRSIAVDLRGHGRSGAPDTGYGAVDLAGDLAELLRRLATGPVVAMGHSLGASVVSALAVEHPELVTAVVCVDPAYLIPDEIAAHTGQLLDAVRSSDPVPVVRQIFGAFESPALPPALSIWHLRRAVGTPGHVLRGALESQLGNMTLYSHSVEYLARRRCPVLVFYADPSRAALEQPLLGDERSRIVTWEGGGHWLHQERPDEFNALVDAWLKAV
jgi:pimeloyl-ACP methyl ester carboxylesterase